MGDNRGIGEATTTDLNAHRFDDGRLVGRDELLTDLLGRVRRGDHLVLRGPPGIGKTRLAADIARRLTDAGRSVDRLLAGTGKATYQLGLFAGAYGYPAGVGPGDVGMLFDAYLGRWRSRLRNAAPTLLWIDDAPHVDDLSASLVRQAVIDGVVQLILTVRSGEALPSDLDALAVEGRAQPVDVPPLDATNTAELAQMWSTVDLSRDDVARIFRLSSGYPLFVRELIRDGAHRELGSPHLDQLVAGRLDRLSSVDRRLAEMVAASEPVDHSLFERDADSLVRLLRAGLIAWHDEHRVRLEHPYYAERLLERLGPLRSQLYSDLVDRADGKAVDPVALTQWTIMADRTPDSALAESASRFALGSADVPMARRLLPHAGPAAPLLEAECRIVEGDLDGGLRALERVRSTPDLPPSVRVEAASTESRHVGLTLGDQYRAHEILNAADRESLDRPLRELLLLGRLWLWLFGPRTDDAGMELIDALLADSASADWTTFELLLASTAVRYQWAGPEAADSNMRRTLEIEAAISPPEFARARVRCVEASFHVHDGRVAEGLEVLRAAAADPDLSSPTSVRLVSGNVALVAALHGDFERAAAGAAAVRAVMETDDDPFRFAEIVRITHGGNHAVAGLGPDPSTWPRRAPLPDGVRTLELMLTTRRRALQDPHAAIIDGVTSLVECGSLGWLVFLYADVGDGRHDAVHRVVRDALGDVAGRGAWRVVHAAASARCAGDPEALHEAGTRLLQMGFVGGASRAFADVIRLERPGSAIHVASVQGAARALRRWKAPRPECIKGLPIPSDHQLAIAEQLIAERSVSAVADEFGVSRRTVENHIYRAARSLGVSGRDELVRCLTD